MTPDLWELFDAAQQGEPGPLHDHCVELGLIAPDVGLEAESAHPKIEAMRSTVLRATNDFGDTLVRLVVHPAKWLAQGHGAGIGAGGTATPASANAVGAGRADGFYDPKLRRSLK